jgi:hypothetical protein
MKVASSSHGKKGKREYLSDPETKSMLGELNDFFETRVEIKRVRHGEHQTIETLINEEALLFARFLRNELKGWIPRIPIT